MLFVAYCMQNASSYHITILLIATDFAFVVLLIRKSASVIRTLGDLVNGDNQEVSGEETIAEPPESLSHLEAPIFVLQSDPKLQTDGAIHLRRYRTRNSSTPGKVAEQSPVKAFEKPPTGLGGPGKAYRAEQ